MAEVGLVRFAHVARAEAEEVLPSYRSKYSKHLFTQPSLLAILCLMRYEDWIFREAEVRLEDRGEHQELRVALGLERVPDYTTLYRFLRRVDVEVVTHATWGGGSASAAARARRNGGRGRCHRVLADGSQSLFRGSDP